MAKSKPSGAAGSTIVVDFATMKEEYDEDRRAPRDHPVGRRYSTLFGDSFDWHPEGLAAYVASGSF